MFQVEIRVFALDLIHPLTSDLPAAQSAIPQIQFTRSIFLFACLFLFFILLISIFNFFLFYSSFFSQLPLSDPSMLVDQTSSYVPHCSFPERAAARILASELIPRTAG